MAQWTPARVALTDTSQQTLVAAPPAGYCIVVHDLCGSNEGGSLSRVDVKDGGSAKFSFAMAANGGGFTKPFPRPWKLTAATALNVQQSAAVNSFLSCIYEVEPA